MGCAASRPADDFFDAPEAPAIWCYLDDALNATSPWMPFLPDQCAMLEAAWLSSCSQPDRICIVDLDGLLSVNVSSMKLINKLQLKDQRPVRRLAFDGRPRPMVDGPMVATLGSGVPLDRHYDGAELNPGGDAYDGIPDSPIASGRSSSSDEQPRKFSPEAVGMPRQLGTSNKTAPPVPDTAGGLFWHYLNKAPPNDAPVEPDTVQRWGELSPAVRGVSFFGTSGSAPGSSSSTSQYPVSSELNFRLALWQGDVTRLKVDALVCCTDESLRGPSNSVAEAVAEAAGAELREACARLAKEGCLVGEARVTRGFGLPTKHVIHTVPPVGGMPESAWPSALGRPGSPKTPEPSRSRAQSPPSSSSRRRRQRAAGVDDDSEALQLERCYTSALAAARLLRCRTVAFTWHDRGLNDDASRKRAAHVALRIVRQLLEMPSARGKPELLVLAFRPAAVDAAEGAVHKLYRDELLPAYFPRSASEERAAMQTTPVLPKLESARLLPLSGRQLRSSPSKGSGAHRSGSPARGLFDRYNRERLPGGEGFSSDDEDDDDSIGAVAGEFLLEPVSDDADEVPDHPDARYAPMNRSNPKPSPGAKRPEVDLWGRSRKNPMLDA